MLQFGNDGRPMYVPTSRRRDHRGSGGARRRGPSWGHSAAINRLAEPKQRHDQDYDYGDARVAHPKAWGAGGGGGARGQRGGGGGGGAQRAGAGWQPGAWRPAHEPPRSRVGAGRQRSGAAAARGRPPGGIGRAAAEMRRRFPPLAEVSSGMSHLEALREQQRAQREQLHELRESHHEAQQTLARRQEMEVEELYEMQAWQQQLQEKLSSLEETTVGTAQRILEEIGDARADVRAVTLDTLAELQRAGRSGGQGAASGAAAVASFLAAVLTELDLCGACSCQEILRRNDRGQGLATSSGSGSSSSPRDHRPCLMRRMTASGAHTAPPTTWRPPLVRRGRPEGVRRWPGGEAGRASRSGAGGWPT
jgi:hypothetical protein